MIPAAAAVGFAAFVIAVLALAALALVALVAVDAAAGWTPRPPRRRPRHLRTRRSPAVQYWARSGETSTAAIAVIDAEGRRVA